MLKTDEWMKKMLFQAKMHSPEKYDVFYIKLIFPIDGKYKWNKLVQATKYFFWRKEKRNFKNLNWKSDEEKF